MSFSSSLNTLAFHQLHVKDIVLVPFKLRGFRPALFSKLYDILYVCLPDGSPLSESH